MIKGGYKSETLARHISCECRCELNGRICNSGQKRTVISVTAIHSKANKISRVKKIMSRILVHVLVSLTKIMRLMNN